MSKQFVIDAVERVVVTFIEAVVGVLILSGTLDLSTGKKALTAGVIAALSAVKALGAKFIGNKDSASLVSAVAAPALPA